MEFINKYRLAKKDLALNKYSYYDENGRIVPTQGQRKILGVVANRILRIQVTLKQLKREISEKLTDIIAYRSQFDYLDCMHDSDLENLENEHKDVEENLFVKENELVEFNDELCSRGILLSEIIPQLRNKEIKKIRSKWPGIKRFLLILLIYLVLEGVFFFAQYVILRDIKSVIEIFIRGIVMIVLMGGFHLVAIMNSKERKPIYVVYLTFSILMILITMFGSPVLHEIYPDQAKQSQATEWSLSDTQKLADNILDKNNSDNPKWVKLYRHLDWAPGIISALFFMVIFFALPNPLFKKETNSPPEKLEDKQLEEHHSFISNGNGDMLWLQQQQKSIHQSINDLTIKKSKIEKTIQDMKNDGIDLIPLRRKLESLMEVVLKSDKEVDELIIEEEELLRELETELDEYQMEYEDLLSHDDIKSSLIKPDWFTRQDIINYFKIA